MQVTHAAVARAIRDSRKLGGQRVFQFCANGTGQHLAPRDLAEYLSRGSKTRFTGKDLRTWTASVVALTALAGVPVPDSAAARRAIRKEMECEVAAVLGNTPAVCRTSYIYPRIYKAWETGELQALAGILRRRSGKRTRKAAEALLLALLKRDSKLR